MITVFIMLFIYINSVYPGIYFNEKIINTEALTRYAKFAR